MSNPDTGLAETHGPVRGSRLGMFENTDEGMGGGVTSCIEFKESVVKHRHSTDIDALEQRVTLFDRNKNPDVRAIEAAQVETEMKRRLSRRGSSLVSSSNVSSTTISDEDGNNVNKLSTSERRLSSAARRHTKGTIDPKTEEKLVMLDPHPVHDKGVHVRGGASTESYPVYLDGDTKSGDLPYTANTLQRRGPDGLLQQRGI